MAEPSLDLVSDSPGLTLRQQVEDAQPDALLVDLEGESLSSTLDALFLGVPDAPAIVVLTDHPGTGPALELLRAGVRAVLPGSATAPEIVAAIEATAAGLHPRLDRGPAAAQDNCGSGGCS